MDDALEVLQELENYLDSLNGTTPDASVLYEFVWNQRSIYGGAVGECAS